MATAAPEAERAFLVYPRFTGLKAGPELGRAASQARSAALLRAGEPDGLASGETPAPT